MSFVRNVRLAGLLALVTAALLVAAPPAGAASVVVTDLSAGTIGVDIPKAVFGVSLTGGGSLTGVSVTFNQVGNDTDFAIDDLQANPDGVAVYRDTSRVGENEDKLDLPGDVRVSSSFTPAGLDVDIAINPAIAPPPAEGAYNLFIVIQTSQSIGAEDDFTISLPSGINVAFQTGLLNPTIFGGTTSGEINVDSEVPTATLTTKPTTADGNVVWTFSEDVVGWTEDNVVLREDGSTDNLAAMVTYNSTTQAVTIDPDDPLTPGAAYDTIVNPDSATEFVTDQAGNPVATNTADVFTLGDVGFTPGVVRGNNWFLNLAFDATHDLAFAFGNSTDYPVVGDWDDDGDFTAGVVRGNVWYLNDDFDSTHDVTFAFGNSTDFPVVGRWVQNGAFTAGVVRGNVWYLNNNFDGTHDVTFAFGRSTDFPVVGDWDKDGDFTAGVVRGNVWYLNNNFDSTHDVTFAFGRSTDFPIVGDWDNDGDFTPGVVRGNVWYLNNNFDATHDVTFAFGRSTDFPIVGDWDGDTGGAGASGLPKLPLVQPGSSASS